jgi:ribosome-binding protein aMBF1 (putative translation factor)
MTLETITRNGRRFVLVPAEEYSRLKQSALPPFPPVAADGTSNAIDFARAAIARRLVTERTAAALSQHELAKLAGVRQETISRIESGKQTATVRILDKLDKALQSANRRRKRATA